jgi:hypothetical protein
MGVSEQERWDKFYKSVTETINRVGRIIIGVPGDEDGPGFSYTIGNHLKGVPELLVVGHSHADFLNGLSVLMCATGKAFEDGKTINMGGRTPVKVIRANAAVRDEYTVQAGEYFGHQDYAVMQVLIPDKHGRFPGEDGCEEPYASVPVFRQQ